MELNPSHPAELSLHHELRDALNGTLDNPSFFVWIHVAPSGGEARFADTERMVAAIDWWLGTLDPDAIPVAEAVPQLDLSDPAAEVRVRALPKKPDARKQRSAVVVGNPEPVLVGWA
jgi:hypothetical protein